MLENMRKTECIFNGAVVHTIIVSVLQPLLPSILAKNGGKFKVSTSRVSAFVLKLLVGPSEYAPLYFKITK